jgi:hypothetical protein
MARSVLHAGDVYGTAVPSPGERRHMVNPWSVAVTISGLAVAVLTGTVVLRDGESFTSAGRSSAGATWQAHLRIVDETLQTGDVRAATRAWRDAYGAALADRGWQGMVAVGDAFLAIGRADATPSGAYPNARRAYLTALIRARRLQSVDGVLRTTEAFAALGDRGVAEQSLRVAAEVAGSDPVAAARVQAAGASLRASWQSRSR